MDLPKSAKVIEGVSDIEAYLRAADKLMREEQSWMLSFQQFEFDDNGNPSILKATGASEAAATPPAVELQRLAEGRDIPWEDGYADRVIAWWASDERVDRHGDIVRQSWNFNNFNANPIILYGHDWDLPPIGISLQEQIVTRQSTAKSTDGVAKADYEGPALRMLPLFATAEQWGWADTIYRLARAKFLRTGSVSFYPGKIIEIEDEEERDELGLGKHGAIYEDNELLEFTIASVPANTGAHQILASMQQKGMLHPADIQPIRELVRRQIKQGLDDKTTWLERDAQWRGIWHTLYPEIKVPKHQDLDATLLTQELAIQSRGSCFFGDPTTHYFTYQPNKETGADENEDDTKMMAEQLNERFMALSDQISEIKAIVDDVRSNQEQGAGQSAIQESKTSPEISSALQDCLQLTDDVLAPSRT